MTSGRGAVGVAAVAAVAIVAGLVGVAMGRHDRPRRAPPSGAPVRIGFNDLELTSGDFSSRDGHGFVDRAEVFRARTRQADFGDVSVRIRLQKEALYTTHRTGARDFDGISLGVRYASPFELYYVNVSRRDDGIAIKKKTPHGPKGRYTTLATGHRPFSAGEWHEVEVTARTTAKGVVVTLAIDGAPVLEATDQHTDGAPLTRPGKVLLRGDNCRFLFDDFEVAPLAR